MWRHFKDPDKREYVHVPVSESTCRLMFRCGEKRKDICKDEHLTLLLGLGHVYDIKAAFKRLKKWEFGGKDILCIYIMCLILYGSNECICIIFEYNTTVEGFS